MKKYLFTITVAIYSLTTFSQGVSINQTGNPANADAILDVSDTTMGLLIPRMTQSQRNNITASSTSLLIYQTDQDSGFYYWDGSSWNPFLVGGATANSGWSTKGNANTIAGTNFIGTTDSIDWVIKTNSNEKMRVTGNGNVGIGTNSPSAKLEIEANDSLLTHWRSNLNGVGLSLNGVTRSTGAVALIAADATDDIQIVAGSGLGRNSDIYIDGPTGNVGIGTTNPSVEFEVFTTGTQIAKFTRDFAIDADINGPELKTSGAHTMGFFINTNEAMHINNSSNVGIGTTDPVQRFEISSGSGTTQIIRNTNETVGQSAMLSFNTGSNGDAFGDANRMASIQSFITGTSPLTATLEFRVNKGDNTDIAMKIDENKNVGINTTTPGNVLQVGGSSSAARNFQVDGNGRSTLRYDDNSVQNVLTLNNRGISAANHGTAILFGINTGTAAAVNSGRIWVASEANYSSAANQDAYMAFSTTANGSAAEKMRITSNGNVGIGTTSPTEKLDVNGTARIRSIGSAAGSPLYYVAGTGVLSTSASDKRLKKNIKSMNNTLEKVMLLRSVTYNWKSNPNSATKDFGFIAQEVAPIFPEVVFTNPTDGYMGINYDRFISVLTKALQQQQQIIENQNSEIKALKENDTKSKSDYEELKSEVEALKSIINQTGKK